MRTIVHLSDLHFGRVDQTLLEPLASAITATMPDLVAVSGDLTQRARASQFKEARAFLDRLPKPQLVVPGNHDIPLYQFWVRFTQPLRRFTRYITADLLPSYFDEEIAVLGVNTARAFLTKGGRVNHAQVGHICQQFGDAELKRVRIVVTHHPFDLPEGSTHSLIGRAQMAVEALAKCGVDIFLAGHLHLTHRGNTARYKIAGHSALVIQAGTASSTRGRGELNSFNVLTVEAGLIDVSTHTWYPERGEFAVSETRSFKRTEGGWL